MNLKEKEKVLRDLRKDLLKAENVHIEEKIDFEMTKPPRPVQYTIKITWPIV